MSNEYAEKKCDGSARFIANWVGFNGFLAAAFIIAVFVCMLLAGIIGAAARM